ncbi:MAG: hypothetical protein ACJ8AT_07080 [Hyalangium sp.]|uniref:hypothetical protein n=1 Tax=Hyalangium sp. TaxID=2028555 RepID=UPI00389A540A
MVKPDVLKHGLWLGAVALVVAFIGCRDFDAALEKCQTDHTCSLDGGLPDGGLPDGGSPDAGPPADPFEGEPPGTCSLDAGLCLRSSKELLYNNGPTFTFRGLWGSRPDDVFLATDDGKNVMRFDGGFPNIDSVAYLNIYVQRLHGTDATNVWAISNQSYYGPCGGMPLMPVPNPSGGTCPTPVARYDGQGWLQLTQADDAGVSITPPALYTTGPNSTWVATSNSGALRWDGQTWVEEPASTSSYYSTIKAFWGPPASAPTFAVGGGYNYGEYGDYWRRGSDGGWDGPNQINVASNILVAIAGPNEQNLYAVGGQNLVLQWDSRNNAWRAETLPTLPPLNPPQSNRQAQDVWVSADGTDVWVTLDTNYVLRKHNGSWSVVTLPVPPDFQAVQVTGFENGDLWFTGVRNSSGIENGTTAYRFRRLK